MRADAQPHPRDPRFFRPRPAPLMAGKPAVNRPASGEPPGFELDLREREVLARIRKAGDDGVAIGDDLTVSTAIRLGPLGLAAIDKGSPQRVRRRFGGRT